MPAASESIERVRRADSSSSFCSTISVMSCRVPTMSSLGSSRERPWIHIHSPFLRRIFSWLTVWPSRFMRRRESRASS